MRENDPSTILENLHRRISRRLSTPIIRNEEIRLKVEQVCKQSNNRACARLLMACLLAKIHKPTLDPRKPYTEIGTNDSFSGRTYDEKYITKFINKHNLPLNSTTAFLTPAFRNLDRPLTLDTELIGRPRQLYRTTLELLNLVYEEQVQTEDLLAEIIRVLINIRNENKATLQTLQKRLIAIHNDLPLSSEEIVSLIEQHLRCKNSSRLPVLVVAAAYASVSKRIKEQIRPLQSHTAADQQTGSLGDIEICVENDDRIVTVYEMKTKPVSVEDINRAITKISSYDQKIDNYIFITTEVVSDEIKSYAASCYEHNSGVEIAILDCIGFLRHFLHLFHRSRVEFLDTYQELLLREPESAVSQALKEAFLNLRLNAETRE
ncbi:MAG TPA: restriction endonuclease, SacI family [Chthonomonas sp.]|uniref:restriction endonuclease, SacI family n=1 Tax=Chthonomonas sp. TaxID=2282153 RepID=UPI002B4AB2AC|nr:restriction endonuclease, SacI family [Chthonomonas sp.]HLI48387.1 restriction endonuclease, SacI family [Chthonomonas sp.]